MKILLTLVVLCLATLAFATEPDPIGGIGCLHSTVK
jgi:hypothetical protein